MDLQPDIEDDQGFEAFDSVVEDLGTGLVRWRNWNLSGI